ncbi:hypothetical protein AVEN_258472-1 [Araneus ventricosus]|uniref:Uncharacterized protein n=1 Tax=Araneus ventricosus TaxID=182803 RepID=A0A4Y2JTP2_ARAVE|nr:hypothetical protein AVEN_258472-1 [Araneus ventricosus]
MIPRAFEMSASPGTIGAVEVYHAVRDTYLRTTRGDQQEISEISKLAMSYVSLISLPLSERNKTFSAHLLKHNWFQKVVRRNAFMENAMRSSVSVKKAGSDLGAIGESPKGSDKGSFYINTDNKNNLDV